MAAVLVQVGTSSRLRNFNVPPKSSRHATRTDRCQIHPRRPHLRGTSAWDTLRTAQRVYRHGLFDHARPPWRQDPRERIAHRHRKEKDAEAGPRAATHSAKHRREHRRRRIGHRQQEECCLYRVQQWSGSCLSLYHQVTKLTPVTVPAVSWRPRHSHRERIRRRELQLPPHAKHPTCGPPPSGLRRRYQENTSAAATHFSRLLSRRQRWARLGARAHMRRPRDRQG